MATDGSSPLPVVFLMGATATGKTRIALQLVQRGRFAIVSVDSAMVYRGMDIGTAKPGVEDQRLAPHRLIDICDPAERYSAGRFREDALREIRAIHAQGGIPLLVGGTGLYFRALQAGLSDLPGANAGVRRRIDEEAERTGWAALHARLARLDPPAAARIHPNDPQRIQRALEILELSGRPPSEHYRERRAPDPSLRFLKLALQVDDRAALRQRIAARFRGMLERGFLDEVRRLQQRGDLHAGLPSMRLVGYRQAWQHLAGELDRPEFIRRAVVATRQLAKRQRTWLRAERGAEWIDPDAPNLVDKVLKFLGPALN